MQITLTPAAQKFIRRLLRFDGGPGSGLRLSVRPGGCPGMTAEFTVATVPAAGEAAFEIDGIMLFLGAESRLLLDQVTVDFVDAPLQSGFVFHDPKASACGCATETPLVTIAGA